MSITFNNETSYPLYRLIIAGKWILMAIVATFLLEYGIMFNSTLLTRY